MKRILIVDDDLDILESLAALLEETYDVALARDGAEALLLAEGQHFDAVVLDLMMPVLNGAGFLQELAARSLHIPTIIVSANAELRSYARRLHATDYLAKPFDIASLEAKLARLTSGPPDDNGAGPDASGGCSSHASFSLGHHFGQRPVALGRALLATAGCR